MEKKAYVFYFVICALRHEEFASLSRIVFKITTTTGTWGEEVFLKGLLARTLVENFKGQLPATKLIGRANQACCGWGSGIVERIVFA